MVSNIFMFNPIPGEMLQFDLRIFFKWVGKNHQLAGIPVANERLAGGSKYFLFSSLPGEMIQFD